MKKLANPEVLVAVNVNNELIRTIVYAVDIIPDGDRGEYVNLHMKDTFDIPFNSLQKVDNPHPAMPFILEAFLSELCSDILIFSIAPTEEEAQKIVEVAFKSFHKENPNVFKDLWEDQGRITLGFVCEDNHNPYTSAGYLCNCVGLSKETLMPEEFGFELYSFSPFEYIEWTVQDEATFNHSILEKINEAVDSRIIQELGGIEVVATSYLLSEMVEHSGQGADIIPNLLA
jgi:hypothetical protein